MLKGAWPAYEIDHRDGVQSNNRERNLRDVPRRTNQQNCRSPRTDNATGLQGVGRTPSGRFRARITVDGKQHLLGCFGTAEEAHEMYVAAKRFLHEGNTL
jgi:hypothetical protein